MVKEYKASSLFNRLMLWSSRLGLGSTVTLTTEGRKSGRPREVPVTPIIVDGQEYLVAPYGEVGWVHNSRTNPSAVLTKGSHDRAVLLVEVTDDAAVVVKTYWDLMKYPRPFMDVPGDATVEDFKSVAGRFPVFRVDEIH